MNSNSVLLEEDEKLLMEYGRAFAHITYVEFFLEYVIYKEGKMESLSEDLRFKLVAGKTLGQKIEIAKSFLDKKLLDELVSFNKKRNVLVHSMTTREFQGFSEGAPIFGKHIMISSGKDSKDLTLDFLQDIVKTAVFLRSEFLKFF
jgi:hypothetical protein